MAWGSGRPCFGADGERTAQSVEKCQERPNFSAANALLLAKIRRDSTFRYQHKKQYSGPLALN
jgi:hypothetical protein